MDKLKILFELFKDKPIAGRRFRGELTKTYKLSCKEVTELYVKIHNYQIDKYGQRLDIMVESMSYGELKRRARILKTIHAQRFVSKQR
jgi:hypothetical protein